MNQRDLSAQARVTPNTVSEIERGREPSLSVLFRICGVLGLQPSELVGLAAGAYQPTDTSRPTMVREREASYSGDLSQLVALKLSETNQNLSSWATILGYMKAVHDMMQAVTASQGRAIEQTEPLVQLQQQIAGRPVPDELLEQIRAYLQNPPPGAPPLEMINPTDAQKFTAAMTAAAMSRAGARQGVPESDEHKAQ